MTKQVAETIIKQLGGVGRLTSMIGAKDFLNMDIGSGKGGLQFRFARAVKSINRVKIMLNSKDLYDITFYAGSAMNIRAVKEFKDIYADQLVSLFEKETGLYLSI
jgi:hypothetical protein